jgi:hypothetical protein
MGRWRDWRLADASAADPEKRANRKGSGIVCQAAFFGCALRSDGEHSQKVEYIHPYPVRAGPLIDADDPGGPAPATTPEPLARRSGRMPFGPLVVDRYRRMDECELERNAAASLKNVLPASPSGSHSASRGERAPQASSSSCAQLPRSEREDQFPCRLPRCPTSP